MVSGGNNSKKAATLARVNSAVSHVGPMNSRPIQGLTGSMEDTNNRHSHGNVGDAYLDVEKRTQKPKKGARNLEAVTGKKNFSSLDSNKKLKHGGGKKREDLGAAPRFGSGTDAYTKKFFKKCKDLLEELMRHKFGWVFNSPVDVKKLKLHDYYTIIKHPMDLGTVKSRLIKHWYKSPKGFAEDIRLAFNNAMTYNVKGQDVHFMADVLLKTFEEKWVAVKAEFNFDESNANYGARAPKPTSKRAPPAVASTTTCTTNLAPSQQPFPSEARMLDSNSKATKIATDQGNTQVLKKHKAKDPDKRDMSYEEKQRLSADLQDLPSDKLDGIVQIIRKRKPGLFQQEDEIEVDIESFDSETLWELDSFVANYKMSLERNQITSELALQATEIAEQDFQEHNLMSSIEEAPKEPGAVEKIGTPVQGEKQGDNVSQSSSSNSDSGSSSSDSSGSDSSSGSGSDAGQ